MQYTGDEVDHTANDKTQVPQRTISKDTRQTVNGKPLATRRMNRCNVKHPFVGQYAVFYEGGGQIPPAKHSVTSPHVL